MRPANSQIVSGRLDATSQTATSGPWRREPPHGKVRGVTQPKEILEAALKLGPTERAALAAEILGSLDSSTYGELGAAWEAEIQSRIEEFEAGRAELIPSEEVFAEVEAALRTGRAPR